MNALGSISLWLYGVEHRFSGAIKKLVKGIGFSR